MRELITRALEPVRAPPAETTAASDGDLDGPSGEPCGAAAELTRAAVLVPLVEHAPGYTVLLTRRTEHLHDHAGQVSFPGGRVAPGDGHPVATALRETEEEIGLGRERIEIAGCLDRYRTGTGFLITPVVGFVRPSFELRLDPFEVADAFEVPLDYILDPRNREIHALRRNGAKRRYYAYRYAEHYIWGATAGMLVNLARRLDMAGGARSG